LYSCGWQERLAAWVKWRPAAVRAWSVIERQALDAHNVLFVLLVLLVLLVLPAVVERTAVGMMRTDWERQRLPQAWSW
jgi:hypothetical protein